MTLSCNCGLFFRIHRPALLGIMAVVSAMCFAAPSTSQANPITYELSGVTASFPSGTLTLTGNFTFDPTSDTLDSVSITATGPTTILETSPETFDLAFGGGPHFINARDPTPVPPVTITFRFAEFLGGLSPNPIIGFDIGNSINLTTSDVAGVAAPLSVPEPSGIVLLASALAGLFRLRSRVHQ